MTNADIRSRKDLLSKNRDKTLEKWIENNVRRPPWAGMCKHGELLDKHCPACLKDKPKLEGGNHDRT